MDVYLRRLNYIQESCTTDTDEFTTHRRRIAREIKEVRMVIAMNYGHSIHILSIVSDFARKE